MAHTNIPPISIGGFFNSKIKHMQVGNVVTLLKAKTSEDVYRLYESKGCESRNQLIEGDVPVMEDFYTVSQHYTCPCGCGEHYIFTDQLEPWKAIVDHGNIMPLPLPANWFGILADPLTVDIKEEEGCLV